MTSSHIGLLAPVDPEFLPLLTSEFEVHPLWTMDQSTWPAHLSAVITNGVVGANAGVMDALPALRLVAVNGVGTDAIDFAEAKRRGIGVTITRGALTADVAELAIALLLGVFRRIAEADRFVRNGRWQSSPFGLGRRLSGTSVGIIGMGNIGRAIAQRLVAFDTRVSYTSPRRKEVPFDYFPDALSLAREVDVLIVAARGGGDTRHLVSTSVLDALGRDGVMINVARGSIVDEDALIQALKTRRIAAAGLDVFADEPNVPTALRVLPNVVLSPHQGSATNVARQTMREIVLANVRAHFAGEPLVTPVDF